ncbi:BtaA family protein [Balneolaceae bacterium YR4-1]|uniref:BtaA family protein n=1 Tax=Halalkalibaculum roseum TaxID=2709311 RepID=A0A6M1SMQ5_9BACT|nr:BtaA family protein [Halalkalibaculum roseum]NGP76319.1 BtaA family protein [Halalkalibaculum roseum]
MNRLQNIVQNLQSKLFDTVVSNRLVYNTCWEDPEIDRELLGLDSESQVIMLSSAGCNALDYLLDEPESIHCIDANPAQNALLDLKKALFEYGSYELLWRLFGQGHDTEFQNLFRENLAELLSSSSRNFWQRHINYFSRPGVEGSFYYRGTSGKVALMIHKRIKYKGVYGQTLNLLDSKSLEEQQYHYQEIEKHLWSAFYKWLFKRNATMALLGVPGSQRDIIENQTEGGLISYINEAMRTVFTQIPVAENYFWRVYLTGSYTQDCCPNYLKKQNFDFYNQSNHRIKTYNSYLHDFLEKNPGSYSHFVLLDHQDWLANAKPELLAKEWQLILDNACPGAKILFRSAARECEFLPEFTQDRLTFRPELTERLHPNDRVGTYGNTYLAEVNN